MSRPHAEVIGDPIAHSKSPLIHGFWLNRVGIEAGYRTCHVRADELGAYFERSREDPCWRGCNVTVPHKERVQPFIDSCDAKAEAIGAVNTVVRIDNGSLIGTNTDVDGVNEALAGLDLAGQEVCVIGGGGAARAAFAALAGKNCAAVHVLARNPAKAGKAAEDSGVFAVPSLLEPGSPALYESSVLINATQLGMTGQDPMPDFILAELSDLADGALVFDMVYAPLETKLLAAARDKGIQVADGLTMLIGQAAVAFERFFGRPAPREHDAELRRMLTA